MAVKVLALASGVTGLADHRILESGLMASAGTLAARGGLLPGFGAGNLTTVSAMVARVAPLKVIIPNGVSAALGPYLLISDANVDITFDAGEASVPRVDRIIARAYDNTNDGSGSTTGSVYYLKGTSGGSATALPVNSILLYEMTIPAGASAGGGGVNFANAVDQRVYTTAAGGIIPVASNAAMSAVSNPYEGMAVYRTDLDVLYIHDGTNFKARGSANVSSSANLSTINNPYDGMIAVTRDTDAVYVYNGSTWVAPKTPLDPIGRLVDAVGGQSLPHNTLTAINFGTGSEDFDTGGFHSTTTNTSRVTPTQPGYYAVNGAVAFTGRSDYAAVEVVLRKNGTAIPSASRMSPKDVSQTLILPVAAKIQCNGTTDYFEISARHVNGASAASSTVVSSQFASSLEWTYEGPITY